MIETNLKLIKNLAYLEKEINKYYSTS